MGMTRRVARRMLAVTLAICWGMAGAGAAEIVVANGMAALPGWSLRIPVSLIKGAGESVAAVQFDLTFDAAVLSVQSVAAGTAAVAAGKDVTYSEVDTGTIRIIVSGLNMNAVPDGTVAYVEFAVASSAEPAFYPVAPVALLASDPLGVSIPVTGTAGALEIRLPVLPALEFPSLLTVACLVLLLGVLRVAGPPSPREETACRRL